MALPEFTQTVPRFGTWGHADRIRFFAWFLHSHDGKEEFSSSDIARCFDKLGIQRPSSTSAFLSAMTSSGNMLRSKSRDGARFKLERAVRQRLDVELGQRDTAIAVTKLLTELPARVPNLDEREFLQETLRCFRANAFRASIVMMWNLAFSHLCDWVFVNHLTTFNTATGKRYPNNKKLPIISRRDQFTEFKESEVLEVANTAGLTGNVHKILDEKLKKRNLAAHPSGITVSQLQAEEFVHDLVTNVVLKLT
jgi:hypothetical protein